MQGGRDGFTLVELAIVLVIIGLLIGGIVGGQSMIETTKTLSMVRQFQQYNIAIQQFKERYRYLPGDYPNGGASFGIGNGNGIILNGNPSEHLLVWKHLQLSQFIPPPLSGQYSGVVGSPYQYPINTATPATPYRNIGITVGYGSNMGGWGSGYYGSSWYDTRHLYFLYQECANWTCQGMTSINALALDTKLDDGIYSSGHVVVGAHGGCTSGGRYGGSNPCFLSYFPPDVFE